MTVNSTTTEHTVDPAKSTQRRLGILLVLVVCYGGFLYSLGYGPVGSPLTVALGGWVIGLSFGIGLGFVDRYGTSRPARFVRRYRLVGVIVLLALSALVPIRGGIAAAVETMPVAGTAPSLFVGAIAFSLLVGYVGLECWVYYTRE
ncbi:hypothetical protein SAMN04487967_2666 [Natronorubrum sediminis]|uniref:Uncharacterized protein n=1 Tax=Natronorubrum sediminis TaxID=640943 RepID=A0A1H6G206_9EURY|nr:hypothetical protein SAMN04487967_2666 [Natronorubrum sediminis]